MKVTVKIKAKVRASDTLNSKMETCVSMTRLWVAVLAAGVLAGCISHPPQPSSKAPPDPGNTIKDGGPDRELDVDHIAGIVPRLEPRTRAGNGNPYTVLGKTYHLVDDTTGFRETGDASWYGTKFHGRLTANGEVYDMYGMTAAHKTLPIPSYVRVTNQRNGKSVVVRINDRGPFHGDRIIDLTYTAAKKLGFVNQGTAPVEIEYLEMVAPPPATAQAKPAAVRQVATADAAPAPANSAGYALPENTYLQVGAFGSDAAALRAQERLTALTHYPVSIQPAARDNLVRVRVGPFKDNLDLMDLQQKLREAKFSEPHVVYE